MAPALSGARGEMNEDRDEDEAFLEPVRRTAYFLWEQAGRPEGRHDEYYLTALEQHRREQRFDRWLEDAPQGD